jgi:hypothetical protein
MTSVSAIIPWRSDDPDRTRIFEWICARWEALHPDWTLITSHDDRTEGPFCRSRAVNRGVDMADTEIVIIADADIAVTQIQTDLMVTVLSSHDRAPWVIGYNLFEQWTPRATKFCLQQHPDTPLPIAGPPRWSSTESVCGLIGLRRADYLQIGGFDERAVGWAGDDVPFAITADTLLGEHLRIPLPCAHLYHPQRADRKTDADAQRNFILEARYREANGDPDAVTALIREHLAVR